jgi:hypothetical protein
MSGGNDFPAADPERFSMHEGIGYHRVGAFEDPAECCPRDIHPCCTLFLREALNIGQTKRL